MGANVATPVSIAETTPEYPRHAPYHPSEAYPEYPFPGEISEEENGVYQALRQVFHRLDLDSEHYGTVSWNPLGSLISPGMRVVVKPNFVLSRNAPGKPLFAVITHPAVLRAVADYCWIALKGEGEIIIADAPQYNCSFSELLDESKLPEVVSFYEDRSGPRVRCLDLRPYWSPKRHFSSQLEPLPGDPEGSLTVDLGKSSMLYSKANSEKFYGAVYHRQETVEHHHGSTQRYELSRTILDADILISVPKLKVHKKVGVTLNAKGLVGSCTNKNCLVHYTLTSPNKGGDQYPDDLFTPIEQILIHLERWMYDHLLAPRIRLLEYLHRSIYFVHNNTTRKLGLKVSEEKRRLDAGNWWGNDSAWRMTADLMKAIHFADKDGNLQASPQRRTFSIIDGVIGGEGEGPLQPDEKPCGVLLGGQNLLAVDLVAARLMGFDPLQLRLYKHLLEEAEPGYGLRALEEIDVRSEKKWQHCLQDGSSSFLDFRPHPGWIGRIEAGRSRL